MAFAHRGYTVTANASDQFVYVWFKPDAGYQIRNASILDEQKQQVPTTSSSWPKSAEIWLTDDIKGRVIYIDAAFRSVDGTHSIVVGQQTELEHGTVTVKVVDTNAETQFTAAGSTTAKEGQTLQLSFEADEGYELDAPNVTYYIPGWAPGQAPSLTEVSKGVYTFEMLGEDAKRGNYVVHINPVFREADPTVTVEFGEGHESFVQSNFGDISGLTVSGTKVTFTVPVGTTVYDAFDSFMGTLNASAMTTDIDNGELFLGTIALNPTSQYASMQDVLAEQSGYTGVVPPTGLTLHALWAVQAEVTITVTPPECGTVVQYVWETNVRARPAPEITVEGNCSLKDGDITCSNWDLSDYGVYGVDDGPLTMKDGNSYTASGQVGSDWGYFAPRDMSGVTVVGGTLLSFEPAGVDGHFEISVPATHLIPDDAVVVEPTCTEAGSKAYICPKCNEGVTETIEALGHDWGSWVVTKEATETEEGTETRACKNDISHIETRAIPKPVLDEEEPAAVSYRIAEGDGQTWSKDSGSTLRFMFERNDDDEETFSHFVGIRVDGADVDASNYAAEPGSVVVTLGASYLEGLAAGNRTLTAVFDDGNDPTAGFTVKPAAERTPVNSGDTDVPKTGAGSAAAPRSAIPTTGDPMRTQPSPIAALAASGIALLAMAVWLTSSSRRGKRAQQ